METEQFRDKLADFRRDTRILYLCASAVIIGLMSGLVAWALLWLIAVITNLCFFGKYSSVMTTPTHHHLGGWVVLLPAVGGLVIGLMARYGSERIRGHGIPEALEAILIGRSRMDAKVAVLKPISSAISIGTGGPFGAEGPIIMTGGAFGSLFAQLFHLTSAERKTLLVAGAAGGMAAVFNTPVAAVLLAVELLLFEWKPRSVIPVGIAVVVATALRWQLLGGGAVFPVPPHTTPTWEILGCALVVGLIAGMVSGILTNLVYFFEDTFARLPIHWMWWPALGGLCVGVAALFNPRVLGVGYDVIANLLAGHIDPAQSASLLIGKGLVWAIALGSGTSGGVLAPLLMMGACLGSIESPFIPFGDRALWSTVGMAAMMGGTMRSPLTAILFTLELTHDLNATPTLLASCLVAYLFTVLVLRRSILTEKVARRGHHISREYSVDPLDLLRCGELMKPAPPAVPADMTVAALSASMSDHHSLLSACHALPIVDGQNNLVGIITRGDMVKAMSLGGTQTEISVLEAGSSQLIVTYPDEILSDAVAKLVTNDIGRLPVVSPEQPSTLLGMIDRTSIIDARAHFLELETNRQRLLKPHMKLSRPVN
ncbi:MAG TPA: chloride channel protein [Candidatus Obscuribacterales bacterium]